MRVIQVQEPGLFTTVQDLGREGFGPMGVSASGAADAISLRIGNRLVGNAEGAAGLEMTLLGGAFLFQDEAVMALTGSDFGATLDSSPVEMWATVPVKAGQVLRLGPTRTGARCYLCVGGGMEVKLLLGSASTHILSGLGGFEGRALRKGDVLEILAAGLQGVRRTDRSVCSTEDSGGANGGRRLNVEVLKQLAVRKVLRVTAGPQMEWFPEAAAKTFCESTYRVSEDSNRMGIRLEGAAISEGSGGTMVSEGVSLGAIQVPEGGQPIILFVEQQTTGGYPKIANVISADFHSLGQLRPRDEIRFERVELETARSLLREQEKLLTSKALIGRS